jgi:RNA polymerase sigma-70 factor (ECF subfamily)
MSPDPFRRRLVDEALVSDELRKAIEVQRLHAQRRSFRWNELLAETDDILNEVAIRALDRLPSFDPTRSRPIPWLMGIAVNVLRERQRWHAREEKLVHQSASTEEQWRQILDRLSESQAAEEDPNPVRQALSQLGLEQRDVLRLRYLEERPYPEIAQALSITVEVARARVCRALNALRRLLEENPEQKGEGE